MTAPNRVRPLSGETSFRGSHDLIVHGATEDLEVRAERVVIATGTIPNLPPGVREDGETVITGSFNFTTAAERQNAENLLVIRDRALAARYVDNWHAHAAHSTRYAGR